ncbi:MAG: ArsB/NhaD family transporter [Solirubrobacteraceae bacterium MAG38_C4-C5]|nr:ArsB/NhaD family transporter [Candidatus Siliceabacter maunaloa]
MPLAIGIFAVVLAAIASDRFARTKVALAGAIAVLLTQTIDQEIAIEAVDWNTIGLLAGMMLIVKVTEPTGVYAYMAIRAAQLGKGRPLGVTVALAATTALLSAFLDNLTTVLLMVPITFLVAHRLEIDPIPLVIIEIVVSNLGGTATLIGDPPNILIAGATDLSFMAFLVNLAPIALAACVVCTLGLYAAFRRRLRIAPEARDRVMALDARAAIERPDELRRTLPVLVLTIVAFFVHRPLGIEPATVALAGATIMLLLTSQSVEEALGGIEWPTLFFFLGLFVLVGALEHTGAIARVADWIQETTAGNRSAELLGIAWFAAVGGALIDNIPMTAAMIPVVEQIAAGTGDDDYWWALALGACFGGNTTIVAAAANVAAAGMAEREGRRIGFIEFLKVGVPVTLVSMIMATAYIVVRYL